MAVGNDIYMEYQSQIHWFKLIDKKLLCKNKTNVSDNWCSVLGLLAKASVLHQSIHGQGLDKTQQLSGKNSKPMSRDKAVWQTQSVTPLGTPDSWQKFGQRVANASGLLNGVDSLLGTQLFSSLADSGQGTLYLTGATASYRCRRQKGLRKSNAVNITTACIKTKKSVQRYIRSCKPPVGRITLK